MKKTKLIKRFKYFKNKIYEVKYRIKKVGNKNFEIINNIKIKIQEIENNIIGIEFIKLENNNLIFSKIELEILKELENDNNIYIFDFNNWNNPVIINKELINKNIDSNLLKYYKKGNIYSESIHLTIFNYKKMINSEYFEELLFSESFLTFLFLNIYNKKFNYKNEFDVEYIIQSIPIDEKIPIKLIFEVDDIEKENLKLNFTMDYFDNKMSKAILIHKIKDLLRKEIYEKLDFEIKLQGYYILDKENFKIKEIKAIQKIKIDKNLFEKEFFIKELLETQEEKEINEYKNRILSNQEKKYIENVKQKNINFHFNKQISENILIDYLNKINETKEFSIKEYKKIIKNFSYDEKKEGQKKLTNYYEKEKSLENFFVKTETREKYTSQEMFSYFYSLIRPKEETFDGLHNWLFDILNKADKIVFPSEELINKTKSFDEKEKLRTLNVVKYFVENENYKLRLEDDKVLEKNEVIKYFENLLKIFIKIDK